MDAMKVITVIQRSDDKHARGANTNDEVNNPYGNSSESGPKGTKDSDQQQASEADAGPATVQGVPATATAAGPAAVQQPVAAAFGGASAACPQMFDISSGSDDDDDDDESEEPPFAPPEGDYGDETERETMTDLIYRSPSSGPGTPDFGFQEVDTDFVSKAAAHLKAQLSGDQACVRLKEELAEMEAAKATAESAKTTLEERLSEKNEVISDLRRELHKLEERTEALLAEGKQALNQAQQKHREEVKDLRVYKVLYESRDEPVQINVNELNFTE